MIWKTTILVSIVPASNSGYKDVVVVVLAEEVVLEIDPEANDRWTAVVPILLIAVDPNLGGAGKNQHWTRVGIEVVPDLMMLHWWNSPSMKSIDGRFLPKR